tara:strand:- start:166 stop:579 length:414 start_codon:yes stop_codon:yes gene_type:complete
MLAKKIALGFGIAIIFPLMIHYGVCTFSPKPQWEDYNTSSYHQATMGEKTTWKEANKRFQTHLFYVAVPFGLTAIIVGTFLPIQAIGTGLMFGGIFSICNGYINYWNELPDSLRFISLLASFIVLVIVGTKKLTEKK